MVNSRERNKLVLFVAFITAALNAFAQPAVMLDDIKAKYKNENSIILNRTEEINLKVASSKVDITMDQLMQIMVITDKAVGASGDQIPYDPNFLMIEDLSACTWIPNGKSYKKMAIKDFSDVQQLDDESFYTSSRYKQFIYPGVSLGAVMESKYTYRVLDMTSLGSFAFGYSSSADNLELVVNVTDDIEIGVFSFGDMSHVTHTTTKKGSVTTHRWSAKSVPAMKYPNYMDSDDKLVPHLYVYVKSYTIKGVKTELFGTKENLYNYNYKFVENVKEEPSAEIKTVVDSIKSKVTGEEEIVKGIFYWVQDNIRYIAFEDGLGGFVPRPANQVCTKKYGDCKDMANIIKSMMDYAGVPGHLCWIGTRSKGYTYDELPLPYCDNHMIAAYKKNDEFIFLDATSKQHPFGFPSDMIQGKEALISIDKDHFETRTVPVINYDQSYVVDSVYMKVDNGVMMIKGRGTLAGFVKSDITNMIQYAGAQNEKDTWKKILKRGNNKCQLVSYTAQNVGDREKAVVVDYEMTLPDYIKTIGDEMYINFNFNRIISDFKPDTLDRKIGADFNNELTDASYFEFDIPAGYKVKELPADFVMDNPHFYVRFSYKEKNGKIIVNKKFELKSIHVPLADIKQFVADIDKVALAYQNVVVLLKTK